MKTKKKLLSHLPINSFTHIPFLILFTFSFVLVESCAPTEPNSNSQISLSLEDVSCTEAWLKLETEDINLPASVSLLQNNSVGQTFSLSKPDTIIYIDSLLPNKTYTFQVSSTRLPIGMIENPGLSNEIQVQTLDTTSHYFTWQTYTFGEQGAGSSYLNDVAVISKDNIWAVGAIYLNDSTGQPDPNAYNAVHWNGTAWELKRIYFQTVCGSLNLSSYPAKTIFAFDDGKVWISSTGDKIAVLKDDIQADKFCLPSTVSMSINSIWGTSSNDLYIVGNGGNIAHYQNGQWSKIEIPQTSPAGQTRQVGTKLDIYDIIGYTNPSNLKIELLCAATDPYNYSNSEILKIININKIEKINLTTNRLTGSVWTKNGFPAYVCGDGIFTNKTGKWEEIKLQVNYTTSKIRGNDLNDIFICGVLGLIAHYNGVRWKIFEEVFNAVYTAADIERNIAVFGGWRDNKAVITIGKRQ